MVFLASFIQAIFLLVQNSISKYIFKNIYIYLKERYGDRIVHLSTESTLCLRYLSRCCLADVLWRRKYVICFNTLLECFNQWRPMSSNISKHIYHPPVGHKQELLLVVPLWDTATLSSKSLLPHRGVRTEDMLVLQTVSERNPKLHVDGFVKIVR